MLRRAKPGRKRSCSNKEPIGRDDVLTDWRRVIAAGQFTKMVKGGFCSASSWVSCWESSFDRPITGWL
jgi:hypothetical protein